MCGSFELDKIIQKDIAKKKSAIELAQDLQTYLDINKVGKYAGKDHKYNKLIIRNY